MSRRRSPVDLEGLDARELQAAIQDDDEAIDVKPFGVNGRFRIAAKLDGKKATDAWRSA